MTKQSSAPSSIRFGISLILLAPGLALIGAAIGLALLALAVLLFISLSGVIAIALVAAGILFLLGGIFLWPVRKTATAMLCGALSSMFAVWWAHRNKGPE